MYSSGWVGSGGAHGGGSFAAPARRPQHAARGPHHHVDPTGAGGDAGDAAGDGGRKVVGFAATPGGNAAADVSGTLPAAAAAAAVAATPVDGEDEIMNREVFAATRISTAGDKKQKEKQGKVRHDNVLGEVVYKDSPSHTIVECMKKGLRKSIASISHADKMRALDPRKDFVYKTKVSFGGKKSAPPSTAKKGKGAGKRGAAGVDAADAAGDECEEKFDFTGYSPMCYRHVRVFLGVDAMEFMDELCNTEWTVSGAGKSSALLYFAGRRYVIKTMTRDESKFLRRILHLYYHHIRNNPHTLIPKYFGHFSVRLQSTGDKIAFVVMNNVFDTGGNIIHEKYDLKGSTVGRFANPTERILKDLDIKQHILIGQRRRKIMLGQIYRDCHFLCKCKIMDYSFLLGIHRPMSAAGRRRVCLSSYDDERCLQADDGGMLNEGGGAEHAGEIYYGGIIDILQEYTTRKRAETVLKGITYDRNGISAVPPDEYAARFCAFLQRMTL